MAQSIDSQGGLTITTPMLASAPVESFDRAALRKVNDPAWGLDIKVDGKRLLVDLNEGVGYNRAGDRTGLPKRLAELLGWAGRVDVRLDGELVGDTFWAFDMVGPDIDPAWEDRRDHLDRFVAAWDPDPHLIRVVPWAIDVEGKADLVARVRQEGLEGLIAKRLGSYYHAGRSSLWQKLKDTKTVDCVVTRLGVDGKKNLAVALWRDGQLVEVGEVSALTGDGPSVQVGDVVEVTFLYLAVNDRLYQPVTPKIRTDKKADECSWEQLPPKPKEMT